MPLANRYRATIEVSYRSNLRFMIDVVLDHGPHICLVSTSTGARDISEALLST